MFLRENILFFAYWVAVLIRIFKKTQTEFPYIEKFTPKTKDPKSVNWLSNRNKYITSYLKAIYGVNATKENDFGYAWLPKTDEGQNASWLLLFDKMHKGQFEGFLAWGQNPDCSGANSNKTRAALGKLKWMVNVNLFDNETGSFWKGPGMNPKDIQTEVILLPASSSVEKEGSITNSGRWAQWRTASIAPMGESLPDSEMVNELQIRVKNLYKKQGGKFPAPILNLTWDYSGKGPEGKLRKVDIHRVAKEINGYYLEDLFDKKVDPPKQLGKKGELCSTFVHLQADGTTSSGNWIYCQSYNHKEGKAINMMSRPKPWGHEFLFFEDNSIAAWYLSIDKGHATSLHCHPNKRTVLIILSGIALGKL